MSELLNCPFCGAKAELFVKELTHRIGTGIYDIELVPTKEGREIIGPNYINRTHRNRETGELEKYTEQFGYLVTDRTYIPRCTNPSCCGRLSKQFTHRETAIALWNNRG